MRKDRGSGDLSNDGEQHFTKFVGIYI